MGEKRAVVVGICIGKSRKREKDSNQTQKSDFNFVLRFLEIRFESCFSHRISSDKDSLSIVNFAIFARNVGRLHRLNLELYGCNLLSKAMKMNFISYAL